MRSLFISRELVESGLWIAEKELPVASLVAQVSLVPRSPSVGLTRDHSTGHSRGCRLHSCLVVCGGFTSPAFHHLQWLSPPPRLASKRQDANLAHCPISSAPQFTTSPVFSSHPFAKGGRKHGAPSAGPDHA